MEQILSKIIIVEKIIKNDYLGDWKIIRFPTPIVLSKFRFYSFNSNSFYLIYAPSLWKCYGSNDGITFTEIEEASNSTTPLTSSNNCINRTYPKNLSTFNTSYLYIGFTLKKKQ